MNKKAKISLMVTLLLVTSLFLFIIIPQINSEEVNGEESVLWKRTATSNIYKNSDGTYTTTLGLGKINRDDKTRRFPNYVPFEDTINVTEENGKLKIEDLVEDKVFYIELEYEKSNPFSLAKSKMNIVKSIGSWYFTTDAQTGVNSMAWKLNTTYDLKFEDEKLRLGDEVVIDFREARVKQNITTTYDDKTNKLTFEIEGGKTGDLRMVDPIIKLEGSDWIAESEVQENDPDSNFGSFTSVKVQNESRADARTRRVYYMVDISSISRTSIGDIIIDSAFLNTTYASASTEGAHVTVNHVFNNSWQEGVITWNNQPCGVNFDNATNCNLTVADTETINTTAEGWNSFNLEGALEYELDLGNNNLSWILKSEDVTNFIQLITKDAGGAFEDEFPQFIVNYTPLIDIITPTPSQTFTQDSPTTYFNITTTVAMDSCHWSEDAGVINYSLSNVAGNDWTLQNTSMVDGSHTIIYSCNQTSDGAWKDSASVSFDVDSVNVTLCRDLSVSRNYLLQNDILLSSISDCINIIGGNLTLDCQGNKIQGTDSTPDRGINVDRVSQQNVNVTIKNCVVEDWDSQGIFIDNSDNITIDNSTIYSNRDIGISISNSDDILLTNLKVSSNGFGVGDDGIRVSNSENNFFVNLTIENNFGDNFLAAGVSNSNFTNIQITNSLSEIGLFLIGNNNFIIDSSSTSNNENDTFLTGASNNIFINFTYSNEFVDTDSDLTRKWYFSSQVNYTQNGTAVSGVNVTAYNISGSIQNTELTDSNGQTSRWELIEYVNIGGSRTFYTNYTFNATLSGWATDSQSINLTTNFINRQFNISVVVSDSTPPNVTINSPTNSTFNTNTIIFNVTALDDTLVDSCLYSLDGGTTNITMLNTTFIDDYTSTNFSMTEGSHTVNFYCNDSLNNLNNSESVTFIVDTINPEVNITSPLNNFDVADYVSGTIPIEINFSASDTNLDTCWYSVSGSQTITNTTTICSTGNNNFTLSLSTSGSFTLTVYANDSANLQNSSSINLSISKYSGPRTGGGGSVLDIVDPNGTIYDKDVLCNQSRQFLESKGNYTNQEFIEFKNLLTNLMGFGIEDQLLLDFIDNIDVECPIPIDIPDVPEPDDGPDELTEFNWWIVIWIVIIIMIIILIFFLTSGNTITVRDGRKT